MGVEVFGSRIPPSIPFGVAWTTYKRTGDVSILLKALFFLKKVETLQEQNFLYFIDI